MATYLVTKVSIGLSLRKTNTSLSHPLAINYTSLYPNFGPLGMDTQATCLTNPQPFRLYFCYLTNTRLYSYLSVWVGVVLAT